MIRIRVPLIAVVGMLAALGGLLPPSSGFAQTNDALAKDTLKKLNETSDKLTDDAKCYKTLFDAYLQLSKPPFEIGPQFNLNTIHPKMDSWSAVSGWAESNPKMAEAILKCRTAKVTCIGLPYGREKLSAAYIKGNVIADIGKDGSLRQNDFPYLHAVDTIAAFATAEVYRLMELGKTQQAMDLTEANGFVLRLFCDRDFLVEKMHAIDLLSDALSNFRDVMYVYQDKFTVEQYADIAIMEVPYLRPDRARLFMPEGDRVVAEALIRGVFDEKSEQVNGDKFASAFAEIQSRELPLTRFGAAKRWRAIAPLHNSLKDSLNRLQLIYDDWWRRWRIDAYDDILSASTQFERTNAIKYAAVVHSLQDVERSFKVRNQLIAEVNGTAMAAGLCAYKKTFGNFPDQAEKVYTQFMRKWSDSDPFDKKLLPLRYKLLTARHAIDTPGRLWIEPKECIVYGIGQDHADNAAATHTDDGSSGDVLLWPPIKSLKRAQNVE